jgi:hypothetical protein
MKRTWMGMAALSAAAVLTLTGCGTIPIKNEPTPTPAPTATPTVAPTQTPTPVPTATTAPRLIGKKTSDSRVIALKNDLSDSLRQLYIRINGYSEWNSNLIPSESIVRVGETVSMSYTPASVQGASGPYDLKIITKDGNTYEIYNVDLDDMENAKLYIGDDGTLCLSYRSLSEETDKTTEGQSSEDSYDDSYDDSYEDSYDSYDYDYNDSYDDDDFYNYDDSYDYDSEYDDDYNGDYDDYEDDYYDDSYSYDDSGDYDDYDEYN